MEEIKKEKKKLRKLYIITNILAVIGLIIVIIFQLVRPFESIYDRYFTIGGYLVIILGLVLRARIVNKLKIISNRYKRIHIKKMIEDSILGSKFNVDEGIWQTKVLDSVIVSLSDEYKTEDLIEGEIDDIKYSSADIEVFSITNNSKGRNTKVRTYLGRFYQFEFTQEFIASVVLKPTRHISYSYYKKYEMPSSRFNESFYIFTNKESDPTKLLRKHLQDRLIDYKTKYGRRISFSFIANKLNISIETANNTFDLTTNKDLTDKEIRKSIDEVKDFIEFAQSINNNVTIFKN